MGGNVWDNSKPIIKENLKNTMDNFFEELIHLVPNFESIKNDFVFIGSTGKKDVSGDIDICIPLTSIYPQNGLSLESYGLEESDYIKTLEKLIKRARTATKEQLEVKAFLKEIYKKFEVSDNILLNDKKIGYNSMFFQAPQYNIDNEETGENVQIDFIFTDNMDWATFAYFSDENSEYKGLHRTQLIIAILSYLGYSFSHSYGFKKKGEKEWNNSVEDLLYLLEEHIGVNINIEDLISFESIHNIFKIEKDIDLIIDIYLKILDSTRTFIPKVLLEYYTNNIDRLNLKGKFLTY